MAKRVCQDLSVLAVEKCGPDGSAADAPCMLRLAAPRWEGWSPGQFVMARPAGAGQLTWGRPLSICRCDDAGLSLLVQTAGRGTALLAAMKPGDGVTLWGPLGNSFARQTDAPTLLLAGGVGIAPFVGYVEQHPAPRLLSLLFGHRPPVACYPFAEPASRVAARHYQELGPGDLDAFISAMDEAIRLHAAQHGLVLACGPLPFLRTVRRLALQHGARAQLSLETRMGCGVGACLGCVVKARSASAMSGNTAARESDAFSHLQTCIKGPIFWADAVQLDESA